MASTSNANPVRNMDFNVASDWCITNSDTTSIRCEFNEKLVYHYGSIKHFKSFSKNTLKSRRSVGTLIADIKNEEIRSRLNKNYINIYSDKYKFTKNIDGVERLLAKDDKGNFKVFLPLEDIFNVYWKAHIENDHPEVRTLIDILSRIYIVNNFAAHTLNYVCGICRQKYKPYSRCTLDIIEMPKPDHALTHIMVYEDICTRFVHLRPVTKDTIDTEICVELLRIFMDFGPPDEVITSDPACEVAIDQIKHLTTFAPIYTKVTVVEPDIKIQFLIVNITEWMEKSGFENWAIGCYALQLRMNNKVKDDNTRTPYNQVFKKLKGFSFKEFTEMECLSLYPTIASDTVRFSNTNANVPVEDIMIVEGTPNNPGPLIPAVAYTDTGVGRSNLTAKKKTNSSDEEIVMEQNPLIKEESLMYVPVQEEPLEDPLALGDVMFVDD